MRILQLAHGLIIPEYISAYSLRVHSLIKNNNKTIISIGGPTIKNIIQDNVIQYRAILLMIYSFIKKNRGFEIYLSEGKFISKKIINNIKNHIKNSDIIIYEGPWLFPLTKDFIEDKFIVYDAHNVEYELRKNNKFRDRAYEIEKSLVERSNLILSFAENDTKLFKELYKNENVITVKHVLNLPDYKWNGLNNKDIIFIGSIYDENIKALNNISKFAEVLKDFKFHIIGNLKDYPGKPKKKNIIYHGLLNEKEKDYVMNNSFLAINPVEGGSGRNLKMVDYIFHGIPILTTEIGARGFDEETKSLFYIEKIENFPNKILELDRKRDELKNISIKLYEQGKKIYEKEYIDIEKILEKYYLENKEFR